MASYTISVLNADIVQSLDFLRQVVAAGLGPLIEQGRVEMNVVPISTGWQEQAISDVPVTLRRDISGLEPYVPVRATADEYLRARATDTGSVGHGS